MRSMFLVALSLLGAVLAVPAPSVDVVATPSPAVTTGPTTTTVIPSPGPAAPGTSPAPGGLTGGTTTDPHQGQPAPLDVPAPNVPAPVTLPPDSTQVEDTTTTTKPSPDTTQEEDAMSKPAPMPSTYFFCQTALKCFDCLGTVLSTAQQPIINLKWNDSRCDDELNCETFHYDSGACSTTTTTESNRLTRQVYNDLDSDADDVDDPTQTGSPSPSSYTAIIVCLVVAVVGGVTVVAFYAIKKKKEREYAEFQA